MMSTKHSIRFQFFMLFPDVRTGRFGSQANRIKPFPDMFWLAASQICRVRLDKLGKRFDVVQPII